MFPIAIVENEFQIVLTVMVSGNDKATAIQYARHAVAIERHPFTLTTLGKVLISTLDESNAGRMEAYNEAFEKLSDAIEIEKYRSRISVHPFVTLISGTTKFIKLGGAVGYEQREFLRRQVEEARVRFKGDPIIASVISQFERVF